MNEKAQAREWSGGQAMSSLFGGLSRPHENGRLELKALPRGSPIATRYARHDATLITALVQCSSSIYIAFAFHQEHVAQIAREAT